MFVIIGAVIVLAATFGAFIMSGGNMGLLMHPPEFVAIFGITAGVAIICAPKDVLIHTIHATIGALKGSGPNKDDYLDLMKVMYELFMLGRRNGLLALDEHVSSPESSSIFSNYPNFLADKDKVSFLCSALRPIIDGKIKPDQLEPLLKAEIDAKKHAAHGPINVLHLLGDSLPGIGIVAAVLGIILTMSVLDQGVMVIGGRISAALTGTFLGIFVAYGFINPLCNLIEFGNEAEETYYICMSRSIGAFARGLAPIMAVELARRSLEAGMVPSADDLENILKSSTGG
ncbi:motility-associated protein [Pelagicoccus sp. SDUM812005]|uniref:motility-associated protein n=1 Tax=Pelagicoccus sp. SDUM812005 TaxID=3041257 RepID=UPI00280E1A1D|nr:motility-associated protein [Pelagicoccus sp. SDUM812005]MDQ8182327.1 MotA/TolQ/ExbB proton channel family protein [Pelagicoccus sp. SDUM812005]